MYHDDDETHIDARVHALSAAIQKTIDATIPADDEHFRHIALYGMCAAMAALISQLSVADADGLRQFLGKTIGRLIEAKRDEAAAAKLKVH